MKHLIRITALMVAMPVLLFAQTYVGSEACKTCHAGTIGNAYNLWKSTAHYQVHLAPHDTTVKGDFTKTVSMGASFGNATVVLRKDAGNFYARLGTAGPEYQIIRTYGINYKQRYLVKIGDSYYVLPIQWNLAKYKDNSSGSWAAYVAGNWFNADGTVKSTMTNSFRFTAYDRACAGCHVAVLSNPRTVAGADTSWVARWQANSSFAEMNVGCESCHGPGSAHVTVPIKANIINPKNLAVDRRRELCGQCHTRIASSGGTFGYAWNETTDKGYIPNEPLASYLVQRPDRWPDNETSRSHRQQWQDMLLSRHFTGSPTIDCVTCHDPHAPTANPVQLKKSIVDNSLCTQCHSDAKYTDGSLSAKNSHSKHTYDPTNANNTGGTSRCTLCHMAGTAANARAYDGNSHTFKVISPKKTLDYQNVTTPTQGMLNSCAVSCHRNPPAGSKIPTLGVGVDATLTNWRESTDIALADTLWKWQRAQFPTRVEQMAQAVPVSFALEQNYPNPFNPSTEIRFHMAKRAEVKLAVYNLAGQEIKTLVDKTMEAGSYRLSWNGKNDYGEYVSSGTYLLRFQAASFSTTKKMILMR